MMAKMFCLLSVLLLSGLVKVNSLQCYECENCLTPPGADHLVTCGERKTTTVSRNPEECPCLNEPDCDCDDTLRKERSISKYKDVEYLCLKSYSDNDGITSRGCALITPKNNLEIGCKYLDPRTGYSCNTCRTDKCNGSYTVQYSIALVATSVVMLFLNKYN